MAKEIKKIDGYVPIELIESCLNGGIIEVKSGEVMKYFERIAGHRIYTPKPIDNVFKEQEEAALKQREVALKNKELLQNKKLTVNPNIPKISKAVGTAAKMPAFMDKNLKIADMYKIATDEATKIRDSSDVLQKKKYGLALAS